MDSKTTALVVGLVVSLVAVVGIIYFQQDEEEPTTDNSTTTDVIDSDSDSDTSDSSDDPATSGPADTSELNEDLDVDVPENNVVEAAQANENLSTLVEAVVAAELDATLSDETMNYTVFAPTNDAFAAIQTTVDTLLLPENQADLVNVLQYHVVDMQIDSEDMTDGDTVETLNGDTLTVNIAADGTVTLTTEAGEVATVTTADVEVNNGVVHVIDTVLVPAE